MYAAASALVEPDEPPDEQPVSRRIPTNAKKANFLILLIIFCILPLYFIVWLMFYLKQDNVIFVSVVHHPLLPAL